MSDIRPELRPSELPGCVRFGVPPAEAVFLGQRLRAAGIQTVACLDGEAAAIEVPAGVTPEAIQAALREHPAG